MFDSQFKENKSLKKRTEMDEGDLPCVSEKIVRLKTEMSLPALKKSHHIDMERIQNDDFNFMKPIGTVKKSHKETSVLPEIIKIFQEYSSKIDSKEIEVDWF